MIGDTISKEEFLNRYKKIPEGTTTTISAEEFQKRYPEILEKKPGFLESLGKEVVRPFVKLGVTGISAARGIERLGKAGIQYLKGEKEGALKTVITAAEPVKFLGFEPIESTQEAVGIGIEIGSTIAGVRAPLQATLAGKVVTGTAIGAGLGLGRGLQVEKEPQKIAIRTATGAAIGGIMSGVFWVAEKGFQKLGEKLNEALVRYAPNPKKASQYLIDNEIKGTAGQIMGKMKTDIQTFEEALKTPLEESSEKITAKELASTVIEQYKNQLDMFGKGDLISLVNKESLTKDILSSLKQVNIPIEIPEEGLTMTQSRALRQLIDDRIVDRTWQRVFFESPATQQGLRMTRNALQDLIVEKVPETASIFQQYSPMLMAKDSLNLIINRASRRAPITFFETAGLLGGLFNPQSAGFTALLMATRRGMDVTIPSYLGGIALNLANQIQKVSTPKAITIIMNLLTRY